ncbi:MAG: DUF86 domain-containing protein [Rhodospirillales bacterium]|nr:DUF86 domain-containing protein [Rhodospirillales bacterium]
MAKNPALYVDHILEAILNIEEDLKGYNLEKFRIDRKARQLLERNLEIISEASRKLPKNLKDGYPDIPWKAIAGIGNVLRHDYHKTYPVVLWETAFKDLPPLKAAILRMGRKRGI